MSTYKERRRWRSDPSWGELKWIFEQVCRPEVALVMANEVYEVGVDSPEKLRALTNQEIDALFSSTGSKRHIRRAASTLRLAQQENQGREGVT